MRKYETKTVPAREEKYLVGRFCDLCKEKIIVLYPTIEIRSTYNYGSDGGNSEEYDCCGSCWKSIIVPLFESKGAKPHESDW